MQINRFAERHPPADLLVSEEHRRLVAGTRRARTDAALVVTEPDEL
jgi:hypothetical protein